MSASPKFSIIIPTRNRAPTLRWTLQTCLEVDHPDFEIVITDNDSSDDTAAIVAAIDDPRVHWCGLAVLSWVPQEAKAQRQ